MIHEKYYALKEEQEKLITRKNEILGIMVFMISINIQ